MHCFGGIFLTCVTLESQIYCQVCAKQAWLKSYQGHVSLGSYSKSLESNQCLSSDWPLNYKEKHTWSVTTLRIMCGWRNSLKCDQVGRLKSYQSQVFLLQRNRWQFYNRLMLTLSTWLHNSASFLQGNERWLSKWSSFHVPFSSGNLFDIPPWLNQWPLYVSVWCFLMQVIF